MSGKWSLESVIQKTILGLLLKHFVTPGNKVAVSIAQLSNL